METHTHFSPPSVGSADLTAHYNEASTGSSSSREQVARYCAHCSKLSSDADLLKFCAVCLSAVYCSRECQRAAWPVHTQTCRGEEGGDGKVFRRQKEVQKGSQGDAAVVHGFQRPRRESRAARVEAPRGGPGDHAGDRGERRGAASRHHGGGTVYKFIALDP
jgi:hypothetical protein